MNMLSSDVTVGGAVEKELGAGRGGMNPLRPFLLDFIGLEVTCEVDEE